MQPRQTLVLLIGLGLAFWFAPLVANFASLTLLALILAAALVPPVDACTRRFGIRREAAVTGVFAAMVACATGATLLIVPTVIDQAHSLAANAPAYMGQAEATLRQLQAQAAVQLGTKAPLPDLHVLVNAAQSHASTWVSSGLGVAGKAISLLGMGAIVLMLAFFLLLEGPGLRQALLSLVPPPSRALLNAQVAPITAKLGGYVQGMVVGIAGLAVYQVIVLSALGLPLALALGLLSALFAVVPLVGGVLGIIPPALVALSVSWQTAVWTLLLGYLGHFIVANFIMPMLFARTVRLSALTITVALLVGSEAFGIFGALIAVPMAAALQVLVQNLYVTLLEQRYAENERDGLRFAEAPLPRLKRDTV